MSARLSAIVGASDDAIISKDWDGVIRSWNPAAEKMFGYTEAEIIGQPIHTIIPPDRTDEEAMLLARIRIGEKIERYETVRLAKSGQRVDVSVTIYPIRNDRGEIVGASTVARDLHDRIAAETAQVRLAAIVESSDDAIVSKTLEGIVETWNRGAERLFGYLAEEMIGRPINIILPDDRQEEETRILERLRRGERVDHFETIRKRKDGRLVDVSVTISAVRSASGHIIGASKVARDITERKIFEATALRMNQELERRVFERTGELEAAHREMEAFNYTIAHDIRGPLRTIVSNTEMIIRDFGSVLPEEAHTRLRRQVEAAMRLSALVDDLLKYSHFGQSSMKTSLLSVTDTASDIASELMARYQHCTFEIEPGMDANADQVLLRVVLQNLMENACKFSPNEGLVKVGKAGDAYFVRDYGIGFDMAFAEKIFLPFERLGNAEQIQGSGVGLATVKRIVERHHGKLWAHSVLGEGSTFFFSLPSNGD